MEDEKYEAWPEAYAEEKWAPGTHLFKPGGTLSNSRECEVCGADLNDLVHMVRPDLAEQKKPEQEEPVEIDGYVPVTAEQFTVLQKKVVEGFLLLNPENRPADTRVSIGWQKIGGPRVEISITPSEVDE